MKLALLISEEVKGTLSKLAKEQLPLDSCLRLIEIIEIVKKKEKELDDLRIELLLKYSNKTKDGKPDLDENQNIKLTDENSHKLAEELSDKYNEDISLPNIKYKEITNSAKITYSCEELIRIKSLLC